MNLTINNTDTARAWVGCLGCYNSGTLNGKWLNGESCADLESAGLADNSGKCNRCAADEFWVFDHENFLGLISGECSPQEAQEKAKQLADLDDNDREKFAAWLACGNDPDIETMEEKYIGEFSTDEEMAEEYVENSGMLNDMHENLRRYFDFTSYARDMMHDINEHNGYYFWAY